MRIATSQETPGRSDGLTARRRVAGPRTRALVVSALLLGLVACSGDDASPATTAAPPSSTGPVETDLSEPTTTQPSGDEAAATETAISVVEQFIGAVNDHDPASMETVSTDGLIFDGLIEGELPSLLAWFDAFDWRWEDATCTATSPEVDVRCELFERNRLTDLTGAERPATVSFTLTDGKVDAVTVDADLSDYSTNAFMPFRSWVGSNHPDDVARMWTPAFGPVLTPESAALFDQRLTDYVEWWPGPAAGGVAVTDGSGRDGDMPGVRVWQLPDAPDGSKPDQAWLAVGSDPDGNIYVSGHDHETNSMLYRLDPPEGDVEWVGDARTASTEADNWKSGETAEKFHTRPTLHDGRMYVATLDSSSIDDAFLSTRGFHWYAYDLTSEVFVDLSADEPDGVGAEHLQVVTIAADPVNDRIYGITIPDNQLLHYDLNEQRTTVVGTPDEWDGYFYSNRFIWTDSRGRVFITGGTERSQWNQGEDRAVLDSVWRYTPDSGFEDTGFALQTMAAIEVGQWNATHDTLYVSDDMGHIYRFTDTAIPTWEYLGRPDFPAGETPDGNNKVWVFQLDPDEETIYLGRSDNFGQPNEIWEFDIATGTSSILATLPDLDATAGSEDFITGYDSWDDDGNFYISSFSMYDGDNTYLISINPDQTRASPPDR